MTNFFAVLSVTVSISINRHYRIWSTNEDQQSDCLTIFDEYQNLKVEKTPEEQNPSSRCRGAISIEFSCEDCEKISTFTILQHKGSTYLGFK